MNSKRRTYGMPYVGSKGLFAEDILSAMPSATHFCDLFAGGCSMSHAALLSGRYKKIHMTDTTDHPQVFLDACRGKYVDSTPPAVGRSEFYALRDTDPMVRIVWSFGSNCMDYAFGEIAETIMAPVSQMLLGETIADRYAAWKAFVRGFQSVVGMKALLSEKAEAARKKVLTLRRCDELRPIERIQRLQELAGTDTDKIDFRRCSYTEAQLPDDSVLYCDPPYKGIKAAFYNRVPFDFDQFYQWAEEKRGIFISEYEMPDAFVDVWSMRKGQNYNGAGKSFVEKLFIPRRNLAEYIDSMERTVLAIPIRESWATAGERKTA